MKNYLIYSTIFCVFASDNIYYRSEFNEIDIRLYYFIFAINLVILSLSGTFVINKKLIIGLTILSISGFLGSVLAPEVLPRFLMTIWGISFMSIYYYVFFRKINVSYIDLFKKYAKGCILFTIFGYFEFIFYLLKDSKFIQFDSFATEASVYCTLVLPAFFYYLQKVIRSRENILEFICVFSGLLLSSSSLGFIGILFSFMFSVRKWRPRIMIPIFGTVCLLVYFAYNTFEKFQSRVDSSVAILQEKEDLVNISALNLSSFYLLSNSYVAINSANTTYGLGHGLGSHSNTYKNTILNVLNTANLGEAYQKAPFDANSLFNRILSDLGYWGIAAAFIFLRKYRIKDPGIHQIISRAILVTIFCRLIRDGRYFNADLFFFLSGYIVIYLEKYGFTKKSIN
ncbi:hypothetical protein [Emticicia soli]|uniref:O-antigen ligase domain-containing protein n=1 Tax=Emticicia soli TaxID=2027878 RepID=A0ABW5J634_9BACT